jgi:hypothetical protein
LRLPDSADKLAAMNIEDIRALKHAQPFRPFEIVTKQGQVHRIALPIRIALAPNGESVAGFADDGSFFLMLSEVAELRTRSKRRNKAA